MYNMVKATKALSDEIRLRMINLLLQRECCVCEVMQVLDISETRASRNLTMLYDAGFLSRRKRGLWSYYSVDKDGLESSLALLLQAVEARLKNNPVALEDRENLKKTKRLSQCGCNP